MPSFSTVVTGRLCTAFHVPIPTIHESRYVTFPATKMSAFSGRIGARQEGLDKIRSVSLRMDEAIHLFLSFRLKM